MTIHFIGAGPGAADLITVRALHLMRQCQLCLYAGSFVTEELLELFPKTTRKINTAGMALDTMIAHMKHAHEAGDHVARLHSGDPCLYSAMAEQMRALDHLKIAYDVTPGVPAFAAAAAALKQELTLPSINQSLILTRTVVNSSSMPAQESLSHLAMSGATIVLHLSAKNVQSIMQELLPFYGAECPIVIAAYISLPHEKILRGRLADLDQLMMAANILRTALIFVGKGMAQLQEQSESFAYSVLYNR